jgi:hypothetical protein
MNSKNEQNFNLVFTKLLLSLKLELSKTSSKEKLSINLLRYEIQVLIRSIVSKEVKINTEKWRILTNTFSFIKTKHILNKINPSQLVLISSTKKILKKLGLAKENIQILLPSEEQLEFQKLYKKVFESKEQSFTSNYLLCRMLISKYSDQIAHELLKNKSFVQPSSAKRYTKDFFSLTPKTHDVNFASNLKLKLKTLTLK